MFDLGKKYEENATLGVGEIKGKEYLKSQSKSSDFLDVLFLYVYDLRLEIHEGTLLLKKNKKSEKFELTKSICPFGL